MAVPRNHYVTLGVYRDASPRDVRTAFRQLAVRLHPDRAGGGSTARFQEIVEAYQVLSDPGQRAVYDESRESLQASFQARGVSPAGAGWGLRPEPLTPAPISLFRDFWGPRASLDEMFERIVRNFTGRGVPKAERLQPLDLDLLLSADEAERGGTVSIGVPVLHPCTRCDGTGRQWPFPCLTCKGEGTVEEEQPVDLEIPPGVMSGTVFEIPLHGLGIRNVYLQVRVRVRH